MTKRKCFSCQYEPKPEPNCEFCKGTGEIEDDGCYCAAYEPRECICGAWDDFDYDEWYEGGD